MLCTSNRRPIYSRTTSVNSVWYSFTLPSFQIFCALISSSFSRATSSAGRNNSGSMGSSSFWRYLSYFFHSQKPRSTNSNKPTTNNTHRRIPHHQIGAFSISLISVMAFVLSISNGCITLSAIGSAQNESFPLIATSGSMANKLSLNEVSIKSCFNCTRPSGRVVVSILPFSTISMPSCRLSPQVGKTTCSVASCVTTRCIAVWSPSINIVESMLALTTIAKNKLIIA